MALMALIEKHPEVKFDESLPEGKWCHTLEYFKLRYPEPRARKVKQEDEFTKLWRARLARMSPQDRAQLIEELDTSEEN